MQVKGTKINQKKILFLTVPQHVGILVPQTGIKPSAPTSSGGAESCTETLGRLKKFFKGAPGNILPLSVNGFKGVHFVVMVNCKNGLIHLNYYIHAFIHYDFAFPFKGRGSISPCSLNLGLATGPAWLGQDISKHSSQGDLQNLFDQVTLQVWKAVLNPRAIEDRAVRRSGSHKVKVHQALQSWQNRPGEKSSTEDTETSSSYYVLEVLFLLSKTLTDFLQKQLSGKMARE